MAKRDFKMPTMAVYIEGPYIFEAAGRDLKRRMVEAFKEGGKEALKFHHAHYMPLHFRADNRTRYGHMPRSDYYRWWKLTRHRSRTDLVRTGKTKIHLTSRGPALTARGDFGEKGVAVTATYKFPSSFRQAGEAASSNPEMKLLHKVKVTPQIMAMEIAAVRADEALQMNRVVHKVYNNKMRDLYRKRVKWRNLARKFNALP